LTQCREQFFSLNELRNPAKMLRTLIPFTPVLSLPPHSRSPLIGLSYSKGIIGGGFFCNFSSWLLSDTLYYTATNTARQVTEHGWLRLHYYQEWNIISKFFRTFQLSPSGKSVTIKTLVLDSERTVKCNNHTLMHTNIRSNFLDTISKGKLGVKLCTISCMYVCVYVFMYVCT